MVRESDPLKLVLGSGAPAFRVLCGGWGTYHAVSVSGRGQWALLPQPPQITRKAGAPM